MAPDSSVFFATTPTQRCLTTLIFLNVEDLHTVADVVNNGVIANFFLPADSTHAHT